MTTIIEGFEPNVPVIFDNNGVPVWWTERQPTFLLTPLPNGNLATLDYGGGMVERRLDGRPVRVLNTQGASSDFHDVLVLPNGHYVLATFDIRRCNLSPWGLGRSRCVFHEFQELTARGRVVWRWRPEDDIGIRQTTGMWRAVRMPPGVADPWHYSSVEWTGDGFIISFRHMNAVYKIDHASKDVVWKLGGTERPRSLRVIGDPVISENKPDGTQVFRLDATFVYRATPITDRRYTRRIYQFLGGNRPDRCDDSRPDPPVGRLVYKPHSSSTTVDLAVFTDDAVQDRWYDPTTGRYANVGDFETTGTHAIPHPGDNASGQLDWVLVVEGFEP